MKIIINNLKIGIDEDKSQLTSLAAAKLNVTADDIKSLRIVKESVDARKKNNIMFVYSVTADFEGNYKIPSDPDVREFVYENSETLIHGDEQLDNRPVIIGSGPAGLFAALTLAENGYRPLIIERGDTVDRRSEKVNRYWSKGTLDSESNVQFGEGGAGTFSDGKLTTRINDYRCEQVLDQFRKSGIPEEVLYKAKPHIGTDKLRKVLVKIRERIIAAGGEFKFRTKMTSLLMESGVVKGIVVNGSDKIAASVVVMAVGHSARDTFEMLFNSGIKIQQKAFSMGVRIEHLQKFIDEAQFGKFAGNKIIGAGEYQLFHKLPGGRTVYTFCMCPGGSVVAAASEPESIVTNGMSEFARNKINANSALVVSVGPSDYGTSHPLAGIEMQRKLERSAFTAGGSNNSAPVQRLGDFMRNRRTQQFGSVVPGYTGEVTAADLNRILPVFIKDPIKDAMKFLDNKLRGFAMDDAVLTGVETRTSSPLRLLRNESCVADGVDGLYPAGEGAGYAGGIVSAAVDGIRAAGEIIKRFRPLD